jgi:hypothetical protein
MSLPPRVSLSLPIAFGGNLNRYFLTSILCVVLSVAADAWAVPSSGSSATNPLSASRSGGNPNDPMVDPGFSTTVLVGTIPSAFYSIAALALGPSEVPRLKPWWSAMGAASGLITIVAGVAHGIVNAQHPDIAYPYAVLGVAAGLPAVTLAAYGWLTNAPPPKASVTILSRNDVTLTPPVPTMMVSPSGAPAVGVSLLNGHF